MKKKENGRGRRQKEKGGKGTDTVGYPVENMVLPLFQKEYGDPSETDLFFSLTCHGTLIHSGFLFIWEHVSGGLYLRLVQHPNIPSHPLLRLSLAPSLTSSPPHNGIISLHITSLFFKVEIASRSPTFLVTVAHLTDRPPRWFCHHHVRKLSCSAMPTRLTNRCTEFC